MTRIIRILIAAAALAAFTFNMAHAQGAATITFNDPNCASWAMSGTAPNFTLTCQSLTCSVSANIPAPLPTDSVLLTASCAGSGGSTTYTWSKFGGPGTCPSIVGSTTAATVSAPGSTQIGCIYRVAASDPTNGGGSANITLNFSATPPASPSNCSVNFTAGSASLPVTGGAIVMIGSCATNVNGSTTYAWTKSAVAFSATQTASDTLAANQGTSAVTWTYAFTATNAGATPTTTTQLVTVAGTGGGGSGIDMTACTAAGYVGHGVDIAWPVAGNTPRVFTTPTVGNFGDSDMIVVRFVAPLTDTSNPVGSTITASEFSSYPSTPRLATLSTAPCVVATSGTPNSTILAASATTGAPNLYMALVGTGFGYQAKLIPGQTYYINYVNRTNYNGAASCTSSSNCAVYIDFKN